MYMYMKVSIYYIYIYFYVLKIKNKNGKYRRNEFLCKKIQAFPEKNQVELSEVINITANKISIDMLDMHTIEKIIRKLED